MLFNSIPFLILFFLLFLAYWKLPGTGVEGRKSLLLLASALFYGWWSIPFLVHFAAVVVLNYSIYFFVRRPGRPILVFLILTNLLHLGFFKYFYFAINILASLLPAPLGGAFQSPTDWLPQIILPLGISFYTFEIISFHIDRYRNEIDYSVGLKDFMLFMMFFPHLLAGPIMRHHELLPYFQRPVVLRHRWLDKGIFLFLVGVLKKVVIADTISHAIEPVFGNPTAYSSTALSTAIYGFTVQIYMDFSGYSDMARGLAYALGYRIPHNFRAPYLSQSFREFWRRWHITLSAWLRDYLYIGLGGNRVSSTRNSFNLMATMILGGLWHGANYTFIIWGALHGTYLMLERWLGLFPRKGENFAIRVLRTAIVFHLAALAWVFFRAPSLASALAMLHGITSNGGPGQIHFPVSSSYLALGAIIVHVYEYRPRWFLIVWQQRMWALPVMAVVVAFLAASLSGDATPFIYFQF